MRIEGNDFFFKDGSSDTFDVVIWATGFSFDYKWIAIKDAFDQKDNVVHKAGVSVVPGLYFTYPQRDYGFILDLPSKAKSIANQLLFYKR